MIHVSHMNRLLRCLLLLLAATIHLHAQDLDLSSLLGDEPEAAPNHFEVHEWGSINLIQGSDRAILGGLTDDQSDLPPFVETWFKKPDRSNIPMMIEKPILYFYTKEAIVANVKVSCPGGFLTQWYPNATSHFPVNPGPGHKLPVMKNGFLEWKWIAVTPHDERNNLQAVANHPWWPITREPDSAVLRVNGAEEKFLFYRGSSSFNSPLKIDVRDGFALSATRPVRHVYTIQAGEETKPVIHYHEQVSVKDGASPAETIATPAGAASHLKTLLNQEGLFPKESDGMVRIWEQDMFNKPGIRAIYLMEPSELDELLPLNIQPTPNKVVRVMLVRVECLTEDRETTIMKLIEQLGGNSFQIRQSAEEALLKTGRIGQGLMTKVWRESDDPEIKVRLKRILRRVTPSRP